MQNERWKVADLPWDQFDASKVNPEILKIIKAAALVEYNAHDYATYLCNVFPNDPAFQKAAQEWSIEEVQHGEALGAWAQKADPAFDFQSAVARYTAGYRVNVNAQESIRGSQTGELIARCIVETGTSSYYTALADATEEPVLKTICRHIAADELRHYKLFYDHLKGYLQREGLSRLERLKISLGRMQESEDDELAYAYFAANTPADAMYDRPLYTSAYMIRAYPFYQEKHVERVVAMVFKACGFKPHTVWQGMANKAAWWVMQSKTKRAIQKAA
ncbi:MAG: ferritin-like domain-containing protein [Alphaproteobacteria bacterium]